MGKVKGHIMSTVILEEPQLHQWTREDYEKMVEIGIIPSDTRVELIEGKVIEMSPQKRSHAIAISLTGDMLRRLFGEGYTIEIQVPMAADPRSQPEPDIMVLKGSARDHAEHPATALLLVEVSDASLIYDRTTKMSLYASAGIEDSWILNLIDEQLEVHRRPIEMNGQAFGYGYADTSIYMSGDVVAPLAMPEQSIQVADILP